MRPCQLCLGTRGDDTQGDEKIVNGIVVCTYCHDDIVKRRPLMVVLPKTAPVNIVPLDVTALIDREGWDCPACGHRHSGRTLAYICIGCPCDQKPPAVTCATDDRS